MALLRFARNGIPRRVIVGSLSSGQDLRSYEAISTAEIELRRGYNDALENRLSAELSPITTEIFEHLVRLAALELTHEEAEYLRRELNQQLQAIRDLEAIELDSHLPITSHGVPYPEANRPALREDVAKPSETADAILDQAPQVEERFLVVPDIPQTVLE